MSEVWFYHLTHQPVDVALPALISVARDRAGWRVMVRGRDAERLAWLDEKLWLQGDESFLPHALAGGDFDADQPVLLGTGDGAPNNAQCLMTIDGAAVSAADIEKFSRVCVIFDGNDEGALTFARGQWRELSGAGHIAKYQSQESGRWELKAQSNV